VKVNVLGPISLEDGNTIDLGSFVTREGVIKQVRMYTDDPAIELELVPEKSTPKILTLSDLTKEAERNGRTTWICKLSIDPNLGGGVLPPGSSVAVRIKGTGQLMRIPVKGNGRS
jgi:hypothetical protein